MFHCLYPDEVPKNLMYFSFVLSCAFLIVMPFLSLYTQSKLLVYSQIHFLVVILLLMILLVKSIINKREGALLSFIGESILGYTCIHDVLLTNHLISGQPQISFGFLVFIFTMSYVLSQKYTDAFLSLKISTKQLRQTQLEIIQQRQLSGIGRLAGGVAHEINNPLGFTIGNVGVIDEYNKEVLNLTTDYLKSDGTNVDTIIERMECIEEDYKELLTDINTGLNRIDQISNDLYQYVKESDETEDIEPVNLNDTIEMSVRLLQYTSSKLFKVYTSLDPIPTFKIPSKDFNKVLLNLIDNAVDSIQDKYKIESEGMIRIRSFYKSEHICIEVEDNGTGIKEEVQSDIFNPFYSTKDVGQGTGLGLSVANEIVRKYNGKITVSSEPVIGSVFRIWLPIDNKE